MPRKTHHVVPGPEGGWNVKRSRYPPYFDTKADPRSKPLCLHYIFRSKRKLIEEIRQFDSLAVV